MNARLADAAFLYKEDRKHALSTNLNKLKTVTFQANLGSLYDKTQRIEQLATLIAKQIGANAEHTARAATLCKADLVSQMVYEFPELQGIMGCYYAQNDEEPSAIGIAIKEHYLPKMAQDLLPASSPGICIALADRIDTLVGLFAIGKIPSGEKDPFALKRQALAVLRIIIEKSLSLDLQQLCQTAYNNYQDKVQNLGAIDKLIDFFFERLRYWYLALHTPARIFEAVLAKRPTEPFDFHQRLLAVRAFQQLPAAESLAAANKRVKNIVDQAPKEIDSVIIDETMLIEQAEKSLYENVQKQERIIAPLFNQAKYQDVLTSLVDLKEPIDLFFEKVMVMVEDETLKNNRLVLLQRLRKLFLVVADISLL
jgi:glycyl-tRNA synthetase beta chain